MAYPFLNKKPRTTTAIIISIFVFSCFLILYFLLLTYTQTLDLSLSSPLSSSLFSQTLSSSQFNQTSPTFSSMQPFVHPIPQEVEHSESNEDSPKFWLSVHPISKVPDAEFNFDERSPKSASSLLTNPSSSPISKVSAKNFFKEILVGSKSDGSLSKLVPSLSIGPSIPPIFGRAVTHFISNGGKSVILGTNEHRDTFFNKGSSGGSNECDFYIGKWIKDEKYPIYDPSTCTYVDEAFNCQINGRPDSDYLKRRWKPDGCDLPRFNATDFLERLRGKRMMLVGDSMNRNQFESMLCLLREGIPDKTKLYEIHGYKITKGRGFYIFKFKDYNCTVEFVRSHFLVKEGVRINAQGNSNPTLLIDLIDKTAGRWKQADILIFNTGHWWTHGKTARGKNYYKVGNHVYPRFDVNEAYRRALKTWANWIDNNINSSRQIVFYRAYSSAHFRGGDWDSGGTCHGETEPISAGAFLDNYPLKMKIVEEVIKQMRVPVTLLNVTRLTNFRKDGHPSIYGKNSTNTTKVSARKQDCSHWCLPGVPDAWNELIYATLVYRQMTIRGMH